jgi:hypothetical protein
MQYRAVEPVESSTVSVIQNVVLLPSGETSLAFVQTTSIFSGQLRIDKLAK